tara:strand:+ start:354 stop:587 length:234 start_codon:yes stop_codon:yes gene_type:complete
MQTKNLSIKITEADFEELKYALYLRVDGLEDSATNYNNEHDRKELKKLLPLYWTLKDYEFQNLSEEDKKQELKKWGY